MKWHLTSKYRTRQWVAETEQGAEAEKPRAVSVTETEIGKFPKEGELQRVNSN